MLTPFPTLLLGIVLGMRHATDADHVVAVTTILTRERRPGAAIRIGALWGIGHTATILLVGGAMILLRSAVPPRLELAMEFLVALMLIGLGVWNLTGRHYHSSPASAAARPIVVGVVHGLAGSAAIALLVLATINDPGWGAAYLLLFGLGTIAGMMAITAAMAAPISLTVSRVAGAERTLRYAAGAVSVTFGLLLATRLILVSGLFATTTR